MSISLRLFWPRTNLSFGNTFGIDYGNATLALPARWNHVVFNSRLFSNTSYSISSKYSYKIRINSNNNDIDITSNIRDLALKEDLQYFIDADNKIDFGFSTIHHIIAPGIINASAQFQLRIPSFYRINIASRMPSTSHHQ